MRNKRIGLLAVLACLTLFALLFTGCQDQDSNSVIDSSSQIKDSSDNNYDQTSDENIADENVTDSTLVQEDTTMENTPTEDTQSKKKTGSDNNGTISQKNTDTSTKINQAENQKKTQNNSGNLSGKFTIDDYMSMNDSLENFTAFVNRRTDFTANQKKQIIEARTRQLEINDTLMAEYKKILTEEEMKAYLVQPAGEALETGMVPTNDAYNRAVQKINQAKSSDTEVAHLTKELSQVKGGILGTFVDKVQKEESKLLGF